MSKEWQVADLIQKICNPVLPTVGRVPAGEVGLSYQFAAIIAAIAADASLTLQAIAGWTGLFFFGLGT